MSHNHPAYRHYANALHHAADARHDIAAREIDAALALVTNDPAFDTDEGDRLLAAMLDTATRINRDRYLATLTV